MVEAKKKKEVEAKDQRVKEIEFVNKLKREIKDEKDTKVQRKYDER